MYRWMPKFAFSFPILEVALDVSILASLVITYLIYILSSAEDRQLHQLERIERAGAGSSKLLKNSHSPSEYSDLKQNVYEFKNPY